MKDAIKYIAIAVSMWLIGGASEYYNNTFTWMIEHNHELWIALEVFIPIFSVFSLIAIAYVLGAEYVRKRKVKK